MARGRRYPFGCWLSVERDLDTAESPFASSVLCPSPTLLFSQNSSNKRRRSALGICSLGSPYQLHSLPKSQLAIILSKLSKSLGMSPALSQSPIAQRHQCANSQHLRISMRFISWRIHERAYPGVFIMDEVSEPFISDVCTDHSPDALTPNLP